MAGAAWALAAPVPTGPGQGPVRFAPGDDYARAYRAGFVGVYVPGPGDEWYALPLQGLSGGTVTVDDLLRVTPDPGVPAYGLRASSGLGGLLAPTILKLRLWTGPEAPTGDLSPGVCGVLDFLAVPPRAAGPCGEASKVQLALGLPTDAEGAALVVLEPVRFA